MKHATTAKVSIIQTAFNNNPTHACNQHIIVTRGLRSHPVHHNFYQIQYLEIFQIATSSHQLHGIELDPSLGKKQSDASSNLISGRGVNCHSTYLP